MPDMLFYGGPIVTVDPARPRAEALLVRGNRIAAVGSLDEVRAAADAGGTGGRRVGEAGGAAAEHIDLQGRTLIPGFNDAHIHLAFTGERTIGIRLVGLTKREILETIRAADAEEREATGRRPARRRRVRRRPLIAYGWDYETCPDPHRRDLDEVVPDRPVVLMQFSGHGAWLNSAALERFGITRDTPDWSMGGAERDESGEPTGIVGEPTNYPPIRRARLRLQLGQILSPKANQEHLRAALRLLAEVGVTSVQDNTWFPWTMWAIRALHRRDELTCRVSCWTFGTSGFFDWIVSRGRFRRNWYDRGPRKYFWDGAFSSHTAWLTEPYADQPDTAGGGMEAGEIEKRLRRAMRQMRQIAAHSIGDAATQAYCEAMERIVAEKGAAAAAELRHRVEHGQLIRPEDVQRLRDFGMVVSAQPHAAAEPEKDRRLVGEERARRAYPYRTLLDAGVPLAFGSDYPGENSYDPLFGMHLAVNREGGEAITPEEALECYTAGSAYAEWREEEKGRLRPGFLADLTILSEDPTTIDRSRMKEIEVHATVVDGRFIFVREGSGVAVGPSASTQ